MLLNFREQLGRVGHRLEFERVAGRIEQEHRRLLARFAGEADGRRMTKSVPAAFSRSASACHSAIASTSPKCGTGTSSPSTGLLARARPRPARMRDDLVTVEIKIDPMVRASAFGTASNSP